MMQHADRKTALDRTYALFERDPTVQQLTANPSSEITERITVRTGLSLYLHQADVRVSPIIMVGVSLFCAIMFATVFGKLLSLYFLPLFFAAGAGMPFLWCERRIGIRASEFAADYPAVLMATASSLKAGMTALGALERSIRLLPKKSLVRGEVERLVCRLSRGISVKEALRDFGADIRQPDLELFRTAFALVLENGGRFAPTLERLAGVCRDRTILIRTAHVSTATMRMTAYILIVMVPLIISMVAVRTDSYWDTLVNHPVANVLASVGVIIIGGSFLILMRMSSFKP